MLPQDSPAQIPLANAWLTLKRGDRSEKTFRHLTIAQPKSAAAWQGLSLALYQQQKWYEATLAAWQASRLAPQNPSSRYLLGSSVLAYAQQFPNENHDTEMRLARAQFLTLTHAWPDNPEVLYKLGQACLGASQFGEAIQNLRRALALSPRPDIAWELAHAYLLQGNTTAAWQVVDTALARDPDDAALHDLRGQILQNSNAAQSLSEYQTAVRLEPNSSRFLECEAAALLRAGQLPEARAAFEQVIRLNPTRAFPYQQIAFIETRLGNPAAAALAARQAAVKNADSESLLHLQTQSSHQTNDAVLHLQLAARYQKLGLTGAARDEYLVALRLKPGNVQARQGLAILKVPLPQ